MCILVFVKKSSRICPNCGKPRERRFRFHFSYPIFGRVHLANSSGPLDDEPPRYSDTGNRLLNEYSTTASAGSGTTPNSGSSLLPADELVHDERVKEQP